MKLLAAILYLHCCILLLSFGHLFPSSLRFIKEGHVSETPDVCVFDIRPLLIKSLGECALFCGLNALCNAFDYCFLNGLHTCRFRYGQTTLSSTTTQCEVFEMTANKDCLGGFFSRSEGICKNMTVSSDLALRKPAHQSSNFYNFTADNAVDGNYGTDIQKDTCTHTESNDHSPWWMVDLQTVYSVTSVRIFNRGLEQDGIDVSDRLRNVSVTVGLTESTVITVCGCFAGPGTLSQVVIIDCPTLPQGRFVKISKTTEFLTLCEVDVFGVAV